MADTHEEQLLSHWLGDITRQDDRLRADHLETRVMAAVARTTRSSPGSNRAWRRAVVAAVAAAVLLPAFLWTGANVSLQTDVPGHAAATAILTETPATTSDRPAPSPVARRRPTLSRNPTAKPAISQTTIAEPTESEPRISQLPIVPSPDRFVPLMPMMPMMPQELTGPFQIVRVQMPRAALGALRSPLDHPNELVEADVLLGEDGMARAIRVSASGSIYPWRSR